MSAETGNPELTYERRVVFLTDEMWAELSAHASDAGLTRSEVVRRAVDDLLRRERRARGSALGAQLELPPGGPE